MAGHNGCAADRGLRAHRLSGRPLHTQPNGSKLGTVGRRGNGNGPNPRHLTQNVQPAEVEPTGDPSPVVGDGDAPLRFSTAELMLISPNA